MKQILKDIRSMKKGEEVWREEVRRRSWKVNGLCM